MYIKDRLTVARAMSMILEEDLQKLEFYMVEHEEEIKKFWNIASVLECESKELFCRTWSVGAEFQAYKKEKMALQLQSKTQSENQSESCKGHKKLDSPNTSKTSPKTSPKASPKVFQTAQGDL